MGILYTTGDATRPQGPGNRLICHCCNDIGGWGSGFVVALSNRWAAPEKAYREWHRTGDCSGAPFELGEVQFVPVDQTQGSQVWVANIIGQHKTIARGEATPVRYEALEKGFERVREFCQNCGFTAHMPRIGSGLARGDWSRIEEIINRVLVDEGSIEVTVYDLP